MKNFNVILFFVFWNTNFFDGMMIPLQGIENAIHAAEMAASAASAANAGRHSFHYNDSNQTDNHNKDRKTNSEHSRDGWEFARQFNYNALVHLGADPHSITTTALADNQFQQLMHSYVEKEKAVTDLAIAVEINENAHPDGIVSNPDLFGTVCQNINDCLDIAAPCASSNLSMPGQESLPANDSNAQSLNTDISDLVAFSVDERHAEEYRNNDSLSEKSHQEVEGSRNLIHENELVSNAKAVEQYQQIISLSNTPEAVIAQFGASLDLLSKKAYMTIETKIALRNFFFRKGHFDPIDTAERQQKAITILMPSIKAHFGQNQAGYIEFMRKNISLPGMRGWYEYETGDHSPLDYIEYGAVRFYSLLTDNSFTNHYSKTRTEEINQAAFLVHWAKITFLCRTEKFDDAKHYIQELKSTNTMGRMVITEREKASLESIGMQQVGIMEAAAKKAETQKTLVPATEKMAAAALMKVHAQSAVREEGELAKKNSSATEALACNQRSVSEIKVLQETDAQVQKEQNPIVTQELKGGGGNATPPDPEKEKDKSEAIIEKQNKQQQLYGHLKQDKEYQECLQKISDIKEQVPNIKIKDFEKADSVTQWNKIQQRAESQYEQIRMDRTDVEKIAGNLKIDRHYVQRIKDHLFYNKHKIETHNAGQQIDRLAADLNIAEAWERMKNNNFVRSDMELFLHEMAESKLEESFSSFTFREIHEFVDTVHNWNSLLG